MGAFLGAFSFFVVQKRNNINIISGSCGSSSGHQVSFQLVGNWQLSTGQGEACDGDDAVTQNGSTVSQSRRLRRRSNVLYYHRRVPLDPVQRFGKPRISFSLGTADPKMARKKRDLEDLKFNAQFEKLREAPGNARLEERPFPPNRSSAWVRTM